MESRPSQVKHVFRNKGIKHQWTTAEDDALIECLLELCKDATMKADNGTFRSGYLAQLEKMMANKISYCTIKGVPHIQSRVKLLKSQYSEISDMMGASASGFGWDYVKQCVTCDDETWKNYVKGHPKASGLRGKPFPHYNELATIFGKDRANGSGVETPADMAENVDLEEAYEEDANAISNAAARASDSCYSQRWENNGLEENLQGWENIDLTTSTPNSPIHNTQKNGAPNVSTQLPREQTENRNKRRRKSTGNDDLHQIFGETMKELVNVCQVTATEISKLSNCFQFMANDATLKQQVFDAVSKIEDLSGMNKIKAGAIISADSAKTNYFFSLPENMRKDYVIWMLQSEF